MSEHNPVDPNRPQSPVQQQNPKQQNPKQQNPKQQNPKQQNPKQQDPKQQDPKQQDPKKQTSEQQIRQQQIRRVTWLGAVIDALLGVTKIITGWLLHSPALIADGFHSLSDLATDVGVVMFSHWAQFEPDEDHPYGHHRYETLGTVLLGTTLIVVASAIAWDSILAFFYSTHAPQASLIAIVVAAISIVSKEWIFRYTYKASKRLNSKLLEANAWHSRSDAFSSIVVLIGVIATWMGYGWVELIAAMVVALMIGKMGVKLSWNASQELVDRGLESEEVQQIEQTIRATSGVQDVHMLRSRMMANHIYLDVHIEVASRVTVSEGHYVAEQVLHSVKQQHDSVSDITVHVDYEKDLSDSDPLAIELPERQFIETQLAEFKIQPDNLQIHYLSNHVILELFFKTEPEDPRAMKFTLDEWTKRTAWLNGCIIYCEMN